MKTTIRHWTARAAFLLTAAGALAADETTDWALKPAIVNSRNFDNVAPAVRFEASWDKKGANAAFWEFYANTSGVVATEREANNEGLAAKAGVGVWQSFRAAPPPSLNLLGSVTQDTKGTSIAEDRSLAPEIAASLDLGFESDQSFDNSQFVIGPKIGFGHSTKGLWSLLPLVHVAYQRVNLVSAEALEALGVPDKDFWRLEVDGLWKFAPFEAMTGEAKWLAPIRLYADVRYFRFNDIPAKAVALSQRENFYVAGDISYELSDSSIPVLQEVYLRVAHGRLPPATRTDTTVYLGVVFGKKKR